MNGKETLKSTLSATQQMLAWYIADLSDDELLIRPDPKANHIAWQLGHLICSEIGLVKSQELGAEFPELPASFSDKYTKEASAKDGKENFHTKEEYLTLFNKVRETTLATLDKLTDADLDKPTQGSMAKFAPKLGDLFVLTSNHVLMHAGQFTVVRRKLDKPILF